MVDTGLLVGRDIYVYCETEEQARELLFAMEAEGYQWYAGGRLTNDTLWPGSPLAYHFHPNKKTRRYVTSRGYEEFLKDRFISVSYPDAKRTHFNFVCCDESETAESISDDEYFSILEKYY